MCRRIPRIRYSVKLNQLEFFPGSQFVEVGIRRELDRAVPVAVLTDGEEVIILRSNERPRGQRIPTDG